VRREALSSGKEENITFFINVNQGKGLRIYTRTWSLQILNEAMEAFVFIESFLRL
jgi:hypothetical protein